MYAGYAMPSHEKLSLATFTKIKLADKDQLAVLNASTQRYQHLETFLTEISQLLHEIYNAVSIMYFKHAQAQQQLFR